MRLFDGHQIVNINASVFNPVKCRVIVADMQAVNGILPMTDEQFFVPVFSGIQITGNVYNPTRVLYADFFLEDRQEKPVPHLRSGSEGSLFEPHKVPFAHFAICIFEELAALLFCNHLFNHSVERLARFPEFVSRFPAYWDTREFFLSHIPDWAYT